MTTTIMPFISTTSSADNDNDDNNIYIYLCIYIYIYIFFQLRLAPTTTPIIASVLDDTTTMMLVLNVVTNKSFCLQPSLCGPSFRSVFGFRASGIVVNTDEEQTRLFAPRRYLLLVGICSFVFANTIICSSCLQHEGPRRQLRGKSMVLSYIHI